MDPILELQNHLHHQATQGSAHSLMHSEHTEAAQAMAEVVASAVVAASGVEEEVDNGSLETLESEDMPARPGDKRKRKEEVTLEDYHYKETEGYMEIWERDVRKGVIAKRAKCVAPVRNENGEEQPCGKVFSRVPNCKRHMLVHAKQDPQLQEVGKVVQDLSVLHQLKEDDIMSNESDFAALQQSMDNTYAYFVFSSDADGKYRRRIVSKKVIKTLPELTEWAQKEFKLDNISAIGVYDEIINDFVQIENPRDLRGAFRFKIYCSPPGLTSSPYVIGRIPPDRSKEEMELRIQLAACYRLFENFGWSELIYNHITASVPGEQAFLINPFGLRFSEITASSLVKVDIDGNIIDPGNTNFGINKAGYVIHSAIHASGRKDIKCIAHCHSTAGVAVSCMKQGLMQINQNSAIVGKVSYHNYEGIAVNLEERIRLVKDLGDKNKILILRNHGLLTCGETVAETFFNMYNLNRACEMQVAALTVGIENVVSITKEIAEFSEQTSSNFNPEGFGVKEFNTLLRGLDSVDPSFRN